MKFGRKCDETGVFGPLDRVIPEPELVIAELRDRKRAAHMNQSASAKIVSSDPHLDPQVLIELNKDPSRFRELPQPKPQDILAALQSETPVDRCDEGSQRPEDQLPGAVHAGDG